MKRVVLAAAVLLLGAATASARDNVSFSINLNVDPYVTTTRVREIAPVVTPVYYPAPRTVDWRPVTVASRGDDDCRTVIKKIYRNGVLVEKRVRTVCADSYPMEERYREHDRWSGGQRRGHERHGHAY